MRLTEQLLQAGHHKCHVRLFGKVGGAARKQNIRGKLGYSRAHEFIRAALQKPGLNPTAFGLQRLRSGVVSEAAVAVQNRLIKHHGGWRSGSAMVANFEESFPSLSSVSRGIQPV